MTTLIQFIASRKIRHNYASMDRKRDAGQTTPADITRYDDILYGKDQRLKKMAAARCIPSKGGCRS